MMDWSIIVPGMLGSAVFLWLIASYNGLIRTRNLIENSWKQIDVQLKRRHDLLPNLMECVKVYIKHEDGIFAKVAQARNLAQQAQKMDEKMEAEGQLTGALMSFISVVEAYPELKANQNLWCFRKS